MSQHRELRPRTGKWSGYSDAGNGQGRFRWMGEWVRETALSDPKGAGEKITLTAGGGDGRVPAGQRLAASAGAALNIGGLLRPGDHQPPGSRGCGQRLALHRGRGRGWVGCGVAL